MRDFIWRLSATLIICMAIGAVSPAFALDCGWIPAPDTQLGCAGLPQVVSTTGNTIGIPYFDRNSSITDTETRQNGYDLPGGESNTVIDVHGICRYHTNKNRNTYFLPFRSASEYIAYLSNLPPAAAAELCAMPATRTLDTVCGSLDYQLPLGVVGDRTDTSIAFTRAQAWVQQVYTVVRDCPTCAPRAVCTTPKNAVPTITTCNVTLHQATGAKTGGPDLASLSGGWVNDAAPTGDCVPAAPTSTMTGTLPVDGACGVACGTPLATAPTDGLCAAGTASAVADVGDAGWAWTCFGANGGLDAPGAAPKPATPPAPSLDCIPTGQPVPDGQKACPTSSCFLVVGGTALNENFLTRALSIVKPMIQPWFATLVGPGDYPYSSPFEGYSGTSDGRVPGGGDSMKVYPFLYADAQTFDSMAMGSKTHVTIYKGRNFTGGTWFDGSGPLVLENKIWPDYAYDLTDAWPHLPMFPPSVRHWSDSNMQPWGRGSSVKVTCDEPAPAPVPVNAVCGSACDVATATAPVDNLCAAGTPSTVTDGGATGWTWTCFGSNGGSNAPGAAPKPQPGCKGRVIFNSGTGFEKQEAFGPIAAGGKQQVTLLGAGGNGMGYVQIACSNGSPIYTYNGGYLTVPAGFAVITQITDYNYSFAENCYPMWVYARDGWTNSCNRGGSRGATSNTNLGQ